MKPCKFPQANKTLTRPVEMTDEECSELSVHVSPDYDALISCWRPTWRERLALLFGRPIWLWVYGHRHPPVSLEVQHPWRKE